MSFYFAFAAQINTLHVLIFFWPFLAVTVTNGETLGKPDSDILSKFGGPPIVIIIVSAATVFLIFIILIKRQLLRMRLISKRGPHFTIASGAPKKLALEIEASIRRVERMKIEPRVLAENVQQSPNEGLRSQTRADSVNNLHNLRYRFKAIDSMTCLDDLLCSVDVRYCRKSHQTVRDHMKSLQRPPQAPLAGSETICEDVVQLYEHARYGKKEFGEQEYEQMAERVEDLKTRLRQKVTIPGTLVSSEVAGSSKEVAAATGAKGSGETPTAVVYNPTIKSGKAVKV